MARRLLLAWLLCCSAWMAHATEARPLADDPALEARVLDIAAELRCLVCQNETIAASHAALAVDLRKQIAHQLGAGQSPQQIREFMVERYGEFVLYRPAFNATTALLWIGPFLLFIGAFVFLWMTLRRRAHDAPSAELDPSDRLRARRLLEQGNAPP